MVSEGLHSAPIDQVLNWVQMLNETFPTRSIAQAWGSASQPPGLPLPIASWAVLPGVSTPLP